MMRNVELSGFSMILRDNSTESLFPFDFAPIGRSEINIKHVVPNIYTLMRPMGVVVGKPFVVEV